MYKQTDKRIPQTKQNDINNNNKKLEQLKLNSLFIKCGLSHHNYLHNFF